MDQYYYSQNSEEKQNARRFNHCCRYSDYFYFTGDRLMKWLTKLRNKLFYPTKFDLLKLCIAKVDEVDCTNRRILNDFNNYEEKLFNALDKIEKLEA